MTSRIAPLIVVFCIATAPLFAEKPWYDPEGNAVLIEGSVVDENDRPAPGIRIVEVGDRTPEKRAETTTDAEGRFTIPRKEILLAGNEDRSLLGIWTAKSGRDDRDTTNTKIVLKPSRTITGTVQDAEGKPIVDALVLATGSYREIVRTLSDAEGKFKLQYPSDLSLEAMLAIKDGAGFDYIWTMETVSSREIRTYGREGNSELRKKSDGPFSLTLDGVKPVRFHCVDENNQPLAGVRIRPWYFAKPGQPNDLNVWITPYDRTSDDLGNVSFDFFPVWQTRGTTFGTDKDGYLSSRVDLTPENYGNTNTVRMRKAIPVRGTLRFPDGTPAQGWTVRAQGPNDFVEYLLSDADGRYEIAAVPDSIVNLNAERPDGPVGEGIDKDWIAVPQLNVETGTEPILVRDFTLEKGTRISGRAVAGNENEPVADCSVLIYCLEKRSDAPEEMDEDRKYTTIDSWWWARTDARGEYEFWVAPGDYNLTLQYGNQYGPGQRRRIEVARGEEQTVDFHVEKVKVDSVRKIRGTALFGEDSTSPVAGAEISFMAHDLRFDAWEDSHIKADENGNFEILGKNEPVYVVASTSDGKWGKIVTVAPDQTEFTVSLEPTASVRGKILDRRSEQPSVGRTATYTIQIPSGGGSFFSWDSHETKTNENGEFVFNGLPTGAVCYITTPNYHYGEETSDGASYVGRDLKLQPGETRVLDDYSFDSRPYGRNEYFYFMYNAQVRYTGPGKNPYEARFELLLERTRRDGKRIFAILVRDRPKEGDPDDVSNFFDLLFKDDDTFSLTERYYPMGVFLDPDRDYSTDATSGKQFVRYREIDPAQLAKFSLAFFDADGNCLGVEPIDDWISLKRQEKVQKEKLMELLKKYATP